MLFILQDLLTPDGYKSYKIVVDWIETCNKNYISNSKSFLPIKLSSMATAKMILNQLLPRYNYRFLKRVSCLNNPLLQFRLRTYSSKESMSNLSFS